MTSPSIFEHFKKTKIAGFRPNKVERIYFQLGFDEFGSFLTVVDAGHRPIDVDYLNYGGAVRSVLRSLTKIKNANDFIIDWRKPTDRIYLGEHEYLLWQLRHCDNVVNSTGQAITFQDDHAVTPTLIINPKDGKQNDGSSTRFVSDLVMTSDGKHYRDFRLLTESYVLAGSRVLEIPPLGDDYGDAAYFQTEFYEKDLQKFLSLFFSYINNVTVVYHDYRTQFSDKKVNVDPSLVFEKVDTEGCLYVRVCHTLPNLGVDFLTGYDLSKIAELNDLERTITVRDIDQEPIGVLLKKVERLLKKHAIKRGRGAATRLVLEENRFIVPPDMARGFIYSELPGLMEGFKIFGADKLKSYKISATQPSLELRLDHGIDFFEGDVDLNFEGTSIPLFDALKQFSKTKYVLLNDGTHAIVNEAYMRKLQRLFQKNKDKVQVSFFDLPAVQELIDDKIAESTFSQSREIFRGFNLLSKKTIRLPAIKANLRPYQKQGLTWLDYLHKHDLGGCLADDMGLGKTLQAIAILLKVYPRQKKPSLVIMPKTLLFNWVNETIRFAPSLSIYTYYEKNRDIKEALKANLIFTTYGLVRNDIKTFKDQDFYYIVLDESQNIKNIESQTTKAVMLLKGKHRLALSGTPIENNLSELYSLFRFLNPPMFGSVQGFNHHYATPIQRENDPEVIQELRKKIYPFVLRRLKKDVLSELPDKIEQTLFVDMSEEQKKFYNSRRQFYKAAISHQIADKGLQQSQFFIFQAFNELRQIASVPEAKTDGVIASSKLELLDEQLVDAITNGHKILIFVNYLAAIDLIGGLLDKREIDFASMTGSTRDRQRLVDRFQNDPECRVFLMTLKTGGTGLNLTAADTIFIFDPWWNKAAEQQAIDRAHRIGQTKKVLSYKLITRNSIEEKIMQLQEKKSELFDNVISTDTISMKTLSEKDIDYMLG